MEHRPELLDGMGVIVGIDKFMSECRALTNFTGNAVATLLIDELSLEADAHGAPTNAPEADAALPEPQTTVAGGQAKAAVVS